MGHDEQRRLGESHQAPGGADDAARRRITYNSWWAMVRRCVRPRAQDLACYGGVTVCARWQGQDGFDNFIADVGERPSTAHTIDRKENAKGYQPGNVRWATRTTQARNRGCVKLTPALAAEMRAMAGTAPQRVIAARFGVSQNIVSKVIAGRLWKVEVAS